MKQDIPLPAVPRPFRQVDVFSPEPFRGNPLAVVHDAGGLTVNEMQQFANWTNLSETTFLVPPTDLRADYGVRIFTPAGELPFAGHPTLGTAHAWLEAGGTPAAAEGIIQECAAGLVRLRHDGGRLAFAAPPLTRTGRVAETQLQQIAAALGLPRADLVDAAWLVNGPEWVGVLLASAEQVLAVRPDYQAMAGLEIGILGPYSGGGPVDFEVRTFIPGDIPVEDPVTGSFNAGAAQWLISSGRAPESYVASQGTVLGRAGRVHVRSDGADAWIGGDCTTRISGTVSI